MACAFIRAHFGLVLREGEWVIGHCHGEMRMKARGQVMARNWPCVKSVACMSRLLRRGHGHGHDTVTVMVTVISKGSSLSRLLTGINDC